MEGCADDSWWCRERTADHSLAFRKDRNMWQQQQVSDFAEKLVIFFLFWLSLLTCVCACEYIFLCMLECSVAACVIAYEGVFMLC